MLRSLLLCCILTAGVYIYRSVRNENECFMTYTYEINFMQPISLEGKALHACQRYQLGVYRESEYTFLPTGSEGTLPVLFIPGSQGNAKQIRSLATIAFEINLINSLNFTFEFFSIDFFEDTSALSSKIIERQTECVTHIIPFIYRLFSKKPVPIVIVGHSMGGLIAHYALAMGTFDPSLVNSVITLASPLKAPVIPLSYSLQSIYNRVHEFWKREPLQPEYDHLTFLSITGGVSDHLVWDGLGAVGLPSDRAFHLSSQAVNRVWLSCDHRCILWCRQLVLRMNHAFFGNINETERMPLSNRKERMELLRSLFLSHPVPMESSLPRTPLSSVGDIDRRCSWVNRVGDPSGVLSTSTHSSCTYLKIGPISGQPNMRLLLITNSLNIDGVYFCDKPAKSVPCGTMHKLPANSIQSIIVPSNSSANHRHRELFVINLSGFETGDPSFSLAGVSVVVNLTYRMEGSLMFDLINNMDDRILEWNNSQSRDYINLPRILNMPTFFRIPLPLRDYFFGPSLPAPRIRIEPDTCSADTDLYGIIIFNLPWDNQIYLHRFNPMKSEAFDLQTISPIPGDYEGLPSPFVDLIVDPRCDNTRVYIYYSYPHWVFQIFRVHFLHSFSLVAGHGLLSVFLLLIPTTLRLQKFTTKTYSDVVSYTPPHLQDGSSGATWRASERVIATIVVHCLAALTVCFLHVLRLNVEDSSVFAKVLPTSVWIAKERQGDLGTTLKKAPVRSTLVSSPFFLLHGIFAIVTPVFIHFIADWHWPLVVALRGIMYLTTPQKFNRLRLGLECRENFIALNVVITCILISGFIHDGAALAALSAAFLIKSVLTPVHQISRFPIILALRLRFVILLGLCSFLCIEQWVTYFFQVKVLFAGYGFESLRIYQPSLLQLLLLFHLLITVVFFNLKTSYRRRRLFFPLLIFPSLFGSFLGSLACLGGYLHAADNLQSCLTIVMLTIFLYDIWAAELSIGQHQSLFFVSLLSYRNI